MNADHERPRCCGGTTTSPVNARATFARIGNGNYVVMVGIGQWASRNWQPSTRSRNWCGPPAADNGRAALGYRFT